MNEIQEINEQATNTTANDNLIKFFNKYGKTEMEFPKWIKQEMRGKGQVALWNRKGSIRYITPKGVTLISSFVRCISTAGFIIGTEKSLQIAKEVYSLAKEELLLADTKENRNGYGCDCVCVLFETFSHYALSLKLDETSKIFHYVYCPQHSLAEPMRTRCSGKLSEYPKGEALESMMRWSLEDIEGTLAEFL